jgi:hypothetical protein
MAPIIAANLRGRQDYSADDFWHRPSAHCRQYVNGARNLGQSRRAAPSRLAILIILQPHTPQISARSTAKKDEGNTKNGNKYLASAYVEGTNFARLYYGTYVSMSAVERFCRAHRSFAIGPIAAVVEESAKQPYGACRFTFRSAALADGRSLPAILAEDRGEGSVVEH